MNDLGLPLGSSFKVKTVLNPVLEKMGGKLWGWKKFHLSKDGSLTLLKSMLSTSPTYYLKLITIPTYVTKCLKWLQ